MRSSRRGASAIEFALLLPIFMVLVGGLLDFAWYFQQRNLVVRAVREGVRVGATTAIAAIPDAGAVATSRTGDVLDELGLDREASVISVAYDDLRVGLTCNTIDTLTLTAVVPFVPVARIVPTPADITVSMTMMLEDGDCA